MSITKIKKTMSITKTKSSSKEDVATRSGSKAGSGASSLLRRAFARKSVREALQIFGSADGPQLERCLGTADLF